MRSVADDPNVAQLNGVAEEVQHPVPGLLNRLLGHARWHEAQVLVPDVDRPEDGLRSVHVGQQAHGQRQADAVPLVDDGRAVAPPLHDLGERLPEDRGREALLGGEEPDFEEDAQDTLAEEVAHVIFDQSKENKR